MLAHMSNHVHSRHSPSEAADESDEFVEIFGSHPTDSPTHYNNQRPEAILEPLEATAVFAVLSDGEDAVLHDADGREEYEGNRHEDGEYVQELDDLRGGARRVQIQQHYWLNVWAKCEVGKTARGPKQA